MTESPLTTDIRAAMRQLNAALDTGTWQDVSDALKDLCVLDEAVRETLDGGW